MELQEKEEFAPLGAPHPLLTQTQPAKNTKCPRVMSWNVMGTDVQIKKRTPVITECILKRKPDIVCLQQVLRPETHNHIDEALSVKNSYRAFYPDFTEREDKNSNKLIPFVGYIPVMVVNFIGNITASLVMVVLSKKLETKWLFLTFFVINFLITPLFFPQSIRRVYECMATANLPKNKRFCNYSGLVTYVSSENQAKVLHAELFPQVCNIIPRPPILSSPSTWLQWWTFSTFLISGFQVTCVNYGQTDKSVLLIVNTRLALTDENIQLLQVEIIHRRLSILRRSIPRCRVVLCGDLNTKTESNIINTLLEMGYKEETNRFISRESPIDEVDDYESDEEQINLLHTKNKKEPKPRVYQDSGSQNAPTCEARLDHILTHTNFPTFST